MKIYQKLKRLTLLLILLIPNLSYSQQTAISEFEYLSPVPGSELNNPNTNIIIRYGPAFSPTDVFSEKLIEVAGDKSGQHLGEIILAEKNKTLLFNPYIPFQEGELVRVRFLRSAKTENDETIPRLSFHFRITEHDLATMVKNNPEKYLLRDCYRVDKPENSISIQNYSGEQIYSVMDNSLPEDFPDIEVDSLTNPAPGYIFMTPFCTWSHTDHNYLIIVDNFGTPVFFRAFTSLLFDFKKLKPGILTYHDDVTSKYYLLDSSYTSIDSLYAKNGYEADFHDIVLNEENHSLLLIYDWEQVAMDTVVPGGDPNAIVIGLVVQEQDENKNVVFQWRSWDHFQITDATYDIDLTNAVVDYVHANSVEFDDDGNILISSRHMDEVTKINRQTGDIIWRWGGENCENNQFIFVNDPNGFSHQHDVRRLDNGNITLFDNGNLHSPQISRVAEYQLDEVNKLAFLVWEYKNDPVSYSVATGNACRLANHNTIIGWGSGKSPAISEVTPTGEVALFLTIPDTLFNYKGFKFPWKTNLFVCNPESLVFGYVPSGDSLELQLEIINNSDQQIEINSIYNRDSVYSVLDTLPITLAPFGSDTIAVKFKPETLEEENFFDILHLRWDTEGQRIAQIVPLIGSTDPNFTSIEPENVPSEYYLSQNYPNPFNPVSSIQYALSSRQFVTLKVYDILGNEVAILVNEEKSAGTYQVEFNAIELSSGIYFYRLQAGSFVETKKMILIK